MKGIMLFLFLSFTSQYCFSQKEAFNWIFGICPEDDPDDYCSPRYGTTVIKFNYDSIERIYSPGQFSGEFYFSTAAISDAKGNFLMAFNGKTLFDSTGIPLDSFISMPLEQFLKPKTSDNIYYLINSYLTEADPPISGLQTLIDSVCYLTKIKVDSSGYEIIQKDTILFDTPNYPGHFEATRHANGRDWWIFKSGLNRNRFAKGILSPTTDLSFETFTTNADTFYNNALIWNGFSADGTKFYHYMSNSFRILDVYDFDRCNGELSNLRSFDFSEHINENDFTPVNLSPDGTKAYFLKNNYGEGPVYQNLQFDIISGEFYNMVSGPSAPCLSPNLKQIIMGHYQRDSNNYITPYLSIINNPNEFGEAYSLDTFAIPYPTLGYLRVPHNWANHMLGPIDGSSCDTLGLDQDYTWLPKVEEETFLVFPNPSSGALNVRSSLQGKLLFNITDLTGKTVFQNIPSSGNFNLEQELKNLPAGLYYLSLQNEHKRLSKKWVKMGF
jgi:hypothetical protein